MSVYGELYTLNCPFAHRQWDAQSRPCLCLCGCVWRESLRSARGLLWGWRRAGGCWGGMSCCPEPCGHRPSSQKLCRLFHCHPAEMQLKLLKRLRVSGHFYTYFVLFCPEQTNTVASQFLYFFLLELYLYWSFLSCLKSKVLLKDIHPNTWVRQRLCPGIMYNVTPMRGLDGSPKYMKMICHWFISLPPAFILSLWTPLYKFQPWIQKMLEYVLPKRIYRPHELLFGFGERARSRIFFFLPLQHLGVMQHFC